MSAVLAPAQRVQATVLATQGRPRGGHLLLIALAGIAAALGAWVADPQLCLSTLHPCQGHADEV